MTPLPFPYTLLLHRTSYIYILLAPFALSETMGWYTPLFNAIVACEQQHPPALRPPSARPPPCRHLC